MLLSRWIGVFALVLAGSAWAHGDWPPAHGGIMSNEEELSFELVRSGQGFSIFVSDHGQPMLVGGTKGTLEVTSGARSKVFDVRSAGDKQLAVRDAVVPPSAKASLKITFANGSLGFGVFKVPPTGVPAMKAATGDRRR